MFYSNNDQYMQDLYAYNQISQNNTYNPFMGNMMPNSRNENIGNIGYNNNMNGMFIPNMNTNMVNQNRNMFQTNSNNANSINNINTQNPNNLYPSIYRIINPVVNRVVSGTNIPYLTEDTLNNMVDTVFNIVEGQIDLEDDIEATSQNEVGNTDTRTTTTTNTNTQNSPSNTRTTTTTDTRNTTNTTTPLSTQTTNISNSSRRRHHENSLLRDLIKILILRQIFSRNCMVQMPFNYPNNYQNQFAYNPNLMSF